MGRAEESATRRTRSISPQAPEGRLRNAWAAVIPVAQVLKTENSASERVSRESGGGGRNRKSSRPSPRVWCSSAPLFWSLVDGTPTMWRIGTRSEKAPAVEKALHQLRSSDKRRTPQLTDPVDRTQLSNSEGREQATKSSYSSLSLAAVLFARSIQLSLITER